MPIDVRINLRIHINNFHICIFVSLIPPFCSLSSSPANSIHIFGTVSCCIFCEGVESVQGVNLGNDLYGALDFELHAWPCAYFCPPLLSICLFFYIPAYVYLPVNKYTHLPPLPYSYTFIAIVMCIVCVMFYIYSHVFVFSFFFRNLIDPCVTVSESIDVIIHTPTRACLRCFIYGRTRKQFNKKLQYHIW